MHRVGTMFWEIIFTLPPTPPFKTIAKDEAKPCEIFLTKYRTEPNSGKL